MAEKPLGKKKWDKSEQISSSQPKTPLLSTRAKKPFKIVHNEYERVILIGDDLSDVPVMFHENLRTEGVL